MSCLRGAHATTLSDFPAEEVLENIRNNVSRNVPDSARDSISIKGHQWGVFGDVSQPGLRPASFTRIFAADCLWMPWEHASLAKSMAYFLSHDDDARVFVVAGFHTGRAKLAPFFDVVGAEGLEPETIYEEDVEGNQRPWLLERDGGREDVTGRKRWLVVATLKRKKASV